MYHNGEISFVLDGIREDFRVDGRNCDDCRF